MANADIQYREMVAVAREYCDMIERIQDSDGEFWLLGMAQLLPRLHASVASLPGAIFEYDPLPPRDLEARFDFYSRLKSLLGERDGYWLEFDVAQDGQCMTGSLADDLTDIYFELRRGLDLLERDPDDPGQALSGWRSGYCLDWGQHLVDAERHLYGLRSRRQLSR